MLPEAAPGKDLCLWGNAPTFKQRIRPSYRLNMSMKLIVPLNSAWATSWDRLTAS